MKKSLQKDSAIFSRELKGEDIVKDKEEGYPNQRSILVYFTWIHFQALAVPQDCHPDPSDMSVLNT